ncbi:MAG: hypothetical protein RRY99_16655, partial [Flavobacterium sp.]
MRKFYDLVMIKEREKGKKGKRKKEKGKKGKRKKGKREKGKGKIAARRKNGSGKKCKKARLCRGTPMGFPHF